MLRGASLHWVKEFDTVSVIARHRARLNELAQAAQANYYTINPIALDYSEEPALRVALEAAITQFGPITLAVCWIHSTAPRAPLVIAESLTHSLESCRFFEIVGSATANPSRIAEESSMRFKHLRSLQYRQIVLGFVTEKDRSRWLTETEISEGVIRSVAEDRDYSVVGTVRPWSARP